MLKEKLDEAAGISVDRERLKTIISVKRKGGSMEQHAQNLLKKLQLACSASSSQITFKFVESQFVRAIRAGCWVLLDNINSAPSDVIERLNSLVEEHPTLNLYEDSSAGGKLSRHNDTIHRTFRLFATANIHRAGSNQLSAALLNRMIRIWLPPMDSQPDDVKELLAHKLALVNVSGAVELSTIAARFHSKAIESSRHDGDGFTFRTLSRALDIAIDVLDRGDPALCLAYGLFRSYIQGLSNPDHRQALQLALSSLFLDPDVQKSHYKYLPVAKEDHPNWKMYHENRIFPCITEIQSVVFRLLVEGLATSTHVASLADATASLIQTARKLYPKDDKTLSELETKAKIAAVEQDVKNAQAEFLKYSRVAAGSNLAGRDLVSMT
jgi:hypothetical protein